MNTAALKPLFVLTLRDPREAAERVLALRLPSQALWIALSLTAILTSVFATTRLLANPLTAAEIQEALQTAQGQQALAMYALFTETPMLVTLMIWGLSVVTVFMMYWTGKALGGQGSLVDVLCVFTLLQVMTLLISLCLWAVNLLLPGLAALGSLAFLIWSVWAIVSFLDVAHRYDSPLKAIGVLLAAVFGTLIGISVITGVIGGLVGGLVGAR